MRYELTFHPLDGWPERHRVDGNDSSSGVRTGEPPPIWLLMPREEVSFGIVADVYLGPIEHRTFYKKTFRWARPASFDGQCITSACYSPDEIRYFEASSSAHADDRAQEYIRARMEGTAWPWT